MRDGSQATCQLRIIGARLVALSAALVLIVNTSVHAQAPRQVVLISHRVTNMSERDADHVTAYCILPNTNCYQEVDSMEIDPPPIETRVDALGQKVITVPLGAIPAGHTRAVRVVMWVRLKAVELLKPGPHLGVAPLSPEEETACLADGELLQLERVSRLTRTIVKDATTDLDKAQKLYEYLIYNCIYSIDGFFHSAPFVLAKFPASCSELAYTYLAMCRSVGIPSRMVSAYVARRGRDPSSDWQNYRWVEIYLADYGWLPADPARRIVHGTRRYFGRQDQRYLAVIDDGLPLPGGHDPVWRVMAIKSDLLDSDFDLRRAAQWRLCDSREKESAAFRRVGPVLRSDNVLQRRQMVAELQLKPDWLRVPHLLEALNDSDEEVRLTAAHGLSYSEDPGMLLALSRMTRVEPSASVREELIETQRSYLKRPNRSNAERALAIRALVKSGTREGLELMRGIWNDPDREVQKAVVETFWRYGPLPEVLEAYRTLRRKGGEYVSFSALVFLARLGDQDANQLVHAKANAPPLGYSSWMARTTLDAYEQSWKHVMAQEEVARQKLVWPSQEILDLMLAPPEPSLGTTQPAETLSTSEFGFSRQPPPESAPAP